jgi:hypothetical protein
VEGVGHRGLLDLVLPHQAHDVVLVGHVGQVEVVRNDAHQPQRVLGLHAPVFFFFCSTIIKSMNKNKYY